ncbi:aminotransferase [Gaertneriomyces semiglobifer]|nr:aminotransferase [Gaertneriomyces semiglobifer]
MTAPTYPGRVEPSTIDFSNIGFGYVKTNGHVRYTWREESGWDAGELVPHFNITLDIAATVLHYGQSIFEGLKAFRMKDGKIRIFRPDLNARRMIKSCKGTCMAAPTEQMFLEAVLRAVEYNKEYVPPYGSSGALYIRPFVFGSGAQVGLSPATEYVFAVLVVPVGEYYKGGMGSPVTAVIKHKFDRAAAYGSGQIKMGGNYAGSLGPTLEAKKKGYTVMLFLDAKENKYVDEFSTSNFAALTAPDAEGKRVYVTPKSTSALESVTNRSLAELAYKWFGWRVERRPVAWEEVRSRAFSEVAACGTAVIISPVKEIHRELPMEIAKIAETGQAFEGFKRLYDAYRALQTGDLEGWENFGWMWPAEGI